MKHYYKIKTTFLLIKQEYIHIAKIICFTDVYSDIERIKCSTYLHIHLHITFTVRWC